MSLMGRWGVLPMNGFENYDSRWFQANLLTRGTDLMLTNLWDWILWTPAAILPLYAIAMADRTGPPRQRLLGSVFLCLVAGYYFYVDSGGNRYGPRYYFEALPFVALPAAWLAMKEASWRDKTNRGRWYFYLFALSLMLAMPVAAWQTSECRRSSCTSGAICTAWSRRAAPRARHRVRRARARARAGR